ncbi:YiiX/YebB-like N1pC/P60 family cysteine hydrolase [Aeromonas veronii]
MSEVKYIIERSKLEPGDIILTSEKSWSSVGIRLATLGKYSHAAIYVGKTIIEATLDGVFSKNPQRILADKPNQIAVFRSKKPLNKDEVIAICKYARSQVGSLYAIPEVIQYKPRSLLRIEETKKQFCSRLVAKSYEAANYDLKNLKHPSFCTPKQLGLCKAFEQIDDIVRLATEAEIEFSKTKDMNIVHHQHTYEWLNKTRKLVEAFSLENEFDIQSINDVSKFLINKPRFDDDISSYVKESGYLEFYKCDLSINRYRYERPLFLNALAHQPDPLAFLAEEYDKEPDLINNYKTNLLGHIKFNNLRKLDFFMLHIKLYIHLLSVIHTRLSLIGLGYLSLQDKARFSAISNEIDIIEDLILKGSEHLHIRSFNV